MAGTNIGGLAATVSADVTPFQNSMRDAARSAEGLSRTSAMLGKSMDALKSASVVAAAAIAASTAAIVGLYSSSSEAIDVQAKLARAVGATTAGFQALAYSADMAGVNQQALAAASGKLNNKIGEAIAAGGKSAEVFQSLGLNVRDLANMDADQRFAAIADSVKTMGMDSTVAGNALKEMGLKGEEMRQFLMDGGDQIRQAKEEMDAFGVSLSNIESNKVEAANDAMTRIGLVAKGVGNQFAVALAPYIEVVSKNIADAAKESHGFRDSIASAIRTGVEWSGKLADAFHYINLVVKGIQVSVSYVAESFISVFAGAAELVAKRMDGWVEMINLVIKGSNTLLGTQYELLSLPSKSPLMDGIKLAAEVAQDGTARLHQELLKLANEPLPSAGVKKFLTDVEAAANQAAATTNADRSRATDTGGASESDAKAAKSKASQQQKNSELVSGLRAETTAIAQELSVRASISDAYRAADLGADASANAQKLADIRATEQVKTIEAEARYQEDMARLQERRAQDLADLAGDKAAIAAVNAQYDAQEILAEEAKQQSITDAQRGGQDARKRLRELERQEAMDTVLGLGSQLMQATQGQSKKAFEFSKKMSIASATIAGYESATDAWQKGMKIGGPWLAAAFSASSLLKTGSLIQSIRGTNFSGGGGGGASAGGGGVPSVAASAPSGGGAAPGPAAGQTQMVSFVGDTFNGAYVEKIAKGLVQFQKDGGTVVWAS